MSYCLLARFRAFVCFAALALAVLPTVGIAAEAKHDFALTIRADERGAAFSDTMHGVFFEDINYAADGGLYAEMVQNRSFEHRAPLFAWSASDDSIDLGRA